MGISEENLKRIFAPLFTTKAKGIGLGLPICKLIVEAHGGAISVESELNKGTIFKITLSIEPKMG
ncbi:MAG: ATP-binding protein [Candidatus Bathyarchaeia archaeon]